MVYPLIDYHETLLGCLESANDGHARAFLRTDDTFGLGPSQITAGGRHRRRSLFDYLPARLRDDPELAAFDRLAPSIIRSERGHGVGP
jgi:hypothetical protein